MDTLTYSIMIGVLFLFGVFVFTYYETPRTTFKRGIRRVKNIQFLSMSRNNKSSLILPEQKDASKQNDLKIYVHEY